MDMIPTGTPTQRVVGYFRRLPSKGWIAQMDSRSSVENRGRSNLSFVIFQNVGVKNTKAKNADSEADMEVKEVIERTTRVSDIIN